MSHAFLSFVRNLHQLYVYESFLSHSPWKCFYIQVNNPIEKVNKIDKPLARLIKKKREKSQINRIRNKNGEITTYNTEIQSIIRDYYQQLYANKMDDLEEMGKLLEKYNLPKLNQDKIENLNRPITSADIETVIKIIRQMKAQDQMASR